MDKKFTDFSFEEANRMASSHTAKQLMELMQHNQSAKEAAASAQSGDISGAKKALEGFMTDPQAKALLRQLWEDYHG
jgi:hypothetical protein